MKLLVIEDDHEAAAYLVKGLIESGHIVDHAANGEDGLSMACRRSRSECWNVLYVWIAPAANPAADSD